MKSLISVNKKFMEISPKRLVEMIKNSKYVKGLEFGVSDCNDEELKYIDDLAFELKKNNLILQIHGNSELSISKQIEILKKFERYSDYLGYKIVITLHSIYDEDKEKSKIKTTVYISNITNSIDNNKLIICLENLNDIPKYDRLEKESISSIVLNDESLYFTYDIGHELIDYGGITNLNKYMIEEIRNVHIHTNDGIDIDHMPIYKNDKHWSKLLKGIVFLINNKYKYNVVYEYDLYKCRGESIEEKVQDYLNSIDFVSEHY